MKKRQRKCEKKSSTKLINVLCIGYSFSFSFLAKTHESYSFSFCNIIVLGSFFTQLFTLLILLWCLQGDVNHMHQIGQFVFLCCHMFLGKQLNKKYRSIYKKAVAGSINHGKAYISTCMTKLNCSQDVRPRGKQQSGFFPQINLNDKYSIAYYWNSFKRVVTLVSDLACLAFETNSSKRKTPHTVVVCKIIEMFRGKSNKLASAIAPTHFIKCNLFMKFTLIICVTKEEMNP